jgi:hypothetical protein
MRNLELLPAHANEVVAFKADVACFIGFSICSLFWGFLATTAFLSEGWRIPELEETRY